MQSLAAALFPLVFFFHLAGPALAQQRDTMRDWQLVLMRPGPALRELKDAERAKLYAGHRKNIRQLTASGVMRLAGPFVVSGGKNRPTYLGMFLLAVRDEAAAAAICAKDPLVQRKALVPEIHTWRGPLDVGSTVSLFNGRDLSGWHADIPAADKKDDLPPSFVVRDGILVSQGRPQGHLITDESFQNYRLLVEWRWPAKPGNCGILVHASKPRMLYKMFPQSIECQLHVNNAGDFWCIGEDIQVPDMLKRRGPKEKWGVVEGKARRIKNLTDGSEKPLGEWNQMIIECRGRRIDVWVNGDKVNDGYACTTDKGQIAIQAEGAKCEFRRVELTRLPPLPR